MTVASTDRSINGVQRSVLHLAIPDFTKKYKDLQAMYYDYIRYISRYNRDL